MRRRAFTLVELLVVIAVIATLVGLLAAAVPAVRMQARSTVTRQRIEAVLQGLSLLGQGDRSTVAYELQRALPGFGGTARFDRSDAAVPPSMVPDPPGPWHATYPDPRAVSPGNPLVAATGDGAPPVWAYPWGQDRRYEIREAWYAGPLGLPNPPATDDDRARWTAPERHVLPELWPRRADDLVVRAGIAPDRATVRRMRGADDPWNDAWGRPLVTAYALFQPPECTIPDLDARGRRAFARDHYLAQARSAYQVNRAVWFAVAAIGPEAGADLPAAAAPDADWAAAFARLWGDACTVTRAAEWDEAAANRPPWDGVRRVRGRLAGRPAVCFVSAPVEMR